MTGTIERRSIIASGLQSRGAGGRTIRGYAALFDSLSEDLGGFREKIAPGAFARALREKQDVRALFNHDGNLILGRTKAGTLRMKEDRHGLAVEIDLPDSVLGKDLYASIERGDVSQMSFAFRMVKDQWDIVEGQHIRTLLECDLFDVSPVVFPAYSDTVIGVRGPRRYDPDESVQADYQWRHDLLRRRLALAAQGF